MIKMQRLIKLLKNKEINQEIQNELDEKVKLLQEKVNNLVFLKDNFFRETPFGHILQGYVKFEYYSSYLMRLHYYHNYGRGLYEIKIILNAEEDKEILRVANKIAAELEVLEREIIELQEVLE